MAGIGQIVQWASTRRAIVNDYALGMTWADLMIKYGVARSTITCALRAHGITRANGRHASRRREKSTKPRRSALTIEQKWERFWCRVVLGSVRPGMETACWIWTGPVDSYGYGALGGERAHRQALVWSGVTLRRGWDVCHRCDNPPCVNPEHLVHASRRVNHHDKLRKGHGGKLRMAPELLIAMPQGMEADLAIR